ncbi:MAG: hypothetical protein ACYTFA_01415 [Planctomycetota bacterium]|jgi:hypothetical protein
MHAAGSSTRDTANRSWSLTLALRSIAHQVGHDIDLDDLHATLGLPLLVCAVPTEHRLSLWPTYARDVFLIEAARAFGISVREVHPPEAARGLDHADEFRQHFDASYRPLIERALENGQPVLAWQGWPGDHEGMWGVITRRCDDGVGFAGTIVASTSPAVEKTGVTLTDPPLQLYVVETVTPTTPSGKGILTLALDHALSVLGNEPGGRFGVMMGPAAFDEWIARLKQSETGENGSRGAGSEDLATGHWRLAASVVDGHRAMLRFLQCHRSDAGADRAKLLDTLVSKCNRVVSELADSTNLPTTRQRIESPSGRAELIDRLTRAREACDTLRDTLKSHLTRDTA